MLYRYTALPQCQDHSVGFHYSAGEYDVDTAPPFYTVLAKTTQPLRTDGLYISTVNLNYRVA